jgi:hypothetical protein
MARLAACLLAVLSLTALADAPRRSRPRIVICGPKILGEKRKPDSVILLERKELPMRPIPLAPSSFRSGLLEPR